MTTGAIIALCIGILITIGAPTYYGFAVSRKSYPIKAHIIYWLAVAFVGAMAYWSALS